MFEFIVVVLGILAAWFLLPIDVAEVVLTVFVLGSGAIGIYWFRTGNWEGLGIFALLLSILGSVRVSIGKVSDKLARARRS